MLSMAGEASLQLIPRVNGRRKRESLTRGLGQILVDLRARARIIIWKRLVSIH